MTHLRLSLLGLCAISLLMACDNEKTSAPESSREAPVVAATPETTPTDDAVKNEAKEADTPALAETDDKGTTILGVGATPEDIEPGASNVYGNNFTIIEPPLALASAIEKAATNQGPYKVEATVEKVCQKKGCWFTLKGENVALPIRVKMKDYAFFVPKNATDLPVVLEGTFEKTTVPQAEAQHYADDEAEGTGKPPRKVEGDQDSWIFTAVAVQIDNKKS